MPVRGLVANNNRDGDRGDPLGVLDGEELGVLDGDRDGDGVLIVFIGGIDLVLPRSQVMNEN